MFVFGKKVSGKHAIKGLMFQRKSMYNNYGMLFDMHHEPKIHSMWMKNTYIPLDIFFLDEDMKIIGFKENNEPHSLKSISIDKPSRYVLEMNGGSRKRYNLNIDDKIHFIDKKNIKFKYF
tara:strand:+ start:100 stop:459 length:360 start_codon:yes stop_codon:yes gene_type:complete